ncbi:folliculin-interacting protein 1-like [Saccostrea echinata]|uniref:folliculin-interacting protein 1-like n=1 Tax=Saccostrea echinata TaxID=191078 RepID=UPI002A823F03|nr:folliculin-interacting protein 1-like [Saccostrea echinata]
MNVKDEYDKQFLNQYQTLFMSDKLRNGTPAEKADIYRSLMGQLQLAQRHGRLPSDSHELLRKEYWKPYTAIVDTHNTEQGLNNFAEGALSICSKYRNESQKWRSSLSLEKIKEMDCYKTYLANVKAKNEQLLPESKQSQVIIKSKNSIIDSSAVASLKNQGRSTLSMSSGGGQGSNGVLSSVSNSSHSTTESWKGHHSTTNKNTEGHRVHNQVNGNFYQAQGRPDTSSSSSLSVGIARGQTTQDNVKMFGNSTRQFANRKPLFGNGGKMYGERENTQPLGRQFGEERPFQNRNMREEAVSLKRPFMEDEDERYGGVEQNNLPNFSGPFRTAKEQLNIDNQKKYGRGRGQVSTASYGATKKSLGPRRGTSSKFVPPVMNREENEENEDVGIKAITRSVLGKNGEKNEEVTDERLKGIEPKMIELIMNEIMDNGPQLSWDDVAGLEFAKKTIKEIVVWPMLRPDIFTGLRGPPKGLLLFGPPGTGKTLIGKCIASQSKSTFFSISASSLTSKWVGEGEKMVRAMFAVARCHQPAVVFIDEVDSLLSQRSDGEHEASRRIKTEFLIQLDGAATLSDERILVIGATNRPQEIDEAARRRFVKRLYIPLPEGEARKQIVLNLLSQQKYQLTAAELDAIQQQSEGYSGSDMSYLCKEAALGPIRSMAFGDIENITAEQVRPILYEDFEAAFHQVRASVSEKDLDLYLEWDKTFGSTSNRKPVVNMALLKIFQNRKIGRNSGLFGKYSERGKEWKPPNFDPSLIRLLIYSEVDGNRIILFDSSSVVRWEDKQQQNPRCQKGAKCRRKNPVNASPTTTGEITCQRYQPKYQLTKPCSDCKTLEEVVFGSVGMAQKGSSLKVHFLWSRMLLTKVFIPTAPKQESFNSDLDFNQSSPSQGDQSSPKLIYHPEKSPSIAQSIPVDVPSSRDRIATFDIYDRDSGLASLTSSGSFQTPFPSPSSNASSYSSLHRRWMRSVHTSIEGCIKKRNSHDNLVAQDTSLGPQPGCRKRRSKLALGIVFGGDEQKNQDDNLLFQNFFFSHITLIEGHLERLKMEVEKAYSTKQKFVDIVMEALETFRSDIMDLYTSPRLSEPVWQSMMSHPSYRYQICENFMKELVTLINKFDSKNNEFFMSTLVTAVLTHHLAWVPTVTPAGGTPSKTYLHNHSAKWLDTLAKTHPYNPLWAQLGDMYGAIGYPLKIARTIIVGKKADLVKKILYILSYFIRCSDVHENGEVGTLESFLDDVCMESPEEDKTPVHEGFKFPSVPDEKLQTGFHISNSVIFNTSSPEVQNNVEIKKCVDRSDLKLDVHSQHSSQRNSNETESSEMNQDEGYCSIVQSDESEKIRCRLSTDCVVENVPVENVMNVNRAAVSRTSDVNEKLVKPAKSSSVLSSKVSNSNDITVEKKPSTADIKHQFLSDRSNSMFNEYFEDDSIVTKTIDDVPLDKRVIHPAMRDIVMSQSLECLTESSDNDTHQRRLGSVGQSARPKLSPLSRQMSSDFSKPSTYNPGRCRSVTPTELNRRRHLSSTSSFDFDHMDPLVHFKELPMPSISSERNSSIKMFDRNFGRSLLAEYSDHYLSNFVLHGTSDNNFKEKLIRDLHMATQHSVLDEPITEAVFIVADTDKWSVDITSSKSPDQPPKVSRVVASQLVCNMMDAVQQLHRLKMSSEFCLMHLEDRLQEIYFKSIMLAEYLRESKTPGQCDIKEMTKLLGFDNGDLPLLVAIAGTHSPQLTLGDQ